MASSKNIIESNNLYKSGISTAAYNSVNSNQNIIVGNNMESVEIDCLVIEENGSWNIVSGNIVKEITGTGILIKTNAVKNIVTGNISLNCSVANLTDNGTSTLVANNITT